MSKQPIRAVACAAAFLMSLGQVSAVSAQEAGSCGDISPMSLAQVGGVVAQETGQVVQIPQIVPAPQLAPAPAVPAPAFTPSEPASPQQFNVTTPLAAPQSVPAPAVIVSPVSAPEAETMPTETIESVPLLDVIEAPLLAIEGTDSIIMPSTIEDAAPILGSELPSVAVPATPAGSFVYVGTNTFGRWVDKPAQRPYAGLDDTDLDGFQREVIGLWEKRKVNSVWVYEIEPGPENDWAGWGPPPPGFVTRSLIPRTADGAFLGGDLPWPPAGQPPAR